MRVNVEITERESQALLMLQKYRYEFIEYRDMLNWQEIEDLDEVLLKIAAKVHGNDPGRENG